MPVYIIYVGNDRRLYGELAPAPLLSALCHGCLEKGLDITQGGTAPYMTESIMICGLATVADSLAAIKKAVFEDKKITIGQLIDSLDKNFQDEEEMLSILEGCPRFGNDDDYVDSIANEVITHFYEEAMKYTGPYGAKWNIGAIVASANVPMGYFVGALPDGRKAGEPISGELSPYQGRSVNGPTATLRSVAKLDHVKMSGGDVLNMRFNPDVLKEEAKMRKFASMVRTFFESEGGALVQFNIVSTDTLRDAQKNPEKYRDLLVRVATYSAFFVELSKELQDNIIARYQFEGV